MQTVIDRLVPAARKPMVYHGENSLNDTNGFCIDGMTYTVPEHSRNQVKKAGDIFIGNLGIADAHEVYNAFTVLFNWRKAHDYPLAQARKTLEKRAKRIDQKAIIAQRSKRLFSITEKLRRFPNMNLATMQDIGGCWALHGRKSSLVCFRLHFSKDSQKNL